MESAPAPLLLRPRPTRHPRPDMNAFTEYLSDSVPAVDDDDQPTPKLSANAALAAETPAARLRALLSRVPNSKPIHSPVPPPSSRSDLVDSDVDPPDDYERPPPANYFSANTSSFSSARESIRDIFMRARREPGGTPQKDNTPKPRRSSFDELDSFPKRTRDRSKRAGKRKSLSDEELETLPSEIRQSERPFASGSHTMSIDNLRERLMDSQTQLQDEYLPFERSDLNISQATPPAATSTPHVFPRKSTNSQAESNLPSQLDSQVVQSNLLDADSEMQRAIDNVESDCDYDNEFNNVPFPPEALAHIAEPPPPPSSSTPRRSRIPLTRSRLNSLDKAYAGPNLRRVSGEVHRSVSRTSSISSNMSLCSDEAERIRERERDWNKPKVPVRQSTPELKQGHRHGRFSSRMDSPMVGGSSARRASINSLDDFSSNSIGSQAEYHEQTAELERERMHERERQWNKRRPRLSYPSPGSLSQTHRERTRAVSLTQVPRPDSVMSVSSTTSLQRHHSFSPSSNTESPEQRGSPGELPEEYLHERERNWNAPRPRWLQNPDARSSPPTNGLPPDGRWRADSIQSTGSSSQNEVDYQIQPLSAPDFKPSPSSPSHSRSPDQNMQHNSPTRNVPHTRSEQGSQLLSPSHSRTRTRSTPSPGPGSRPTQIPVRTPTKSGKTFTRATDMQQNVNHEHSNGNVTVDSVNDIQSRNHVEGKINPKYGSLITKPRYTLGIDGIDESVSQDHTPTIRTINPPPAENLESPYFDSRTSNVALNLADTKSSRLQELPPRKSRAKEVASFLQTPPRHFTVSSSANFDFQSPSPPRGLPELPGPPSMSDDEGVEELAYTSIAWERTQGHSTVEDVVAGIGNLTVMKTPRPPGAWLTTPTPENIADGAAKVQESSIASEYSDEHPTPVASLSRASALQTPAPPGAWIPTPAGSSRKSILRVRFEPPPSESTETEQSIAASSENSENSDHRPEMLRRSSSPTNRPAQSIEPPLAVRSRTPDLQTSIAKPQSPKSPRKSPKIRVLDAFGREATDYVTKNEGATDLPMNTPRNRSAIRIVDAMGREVDEGSRQDFREELVPEESSPSPLDRHEALMRLRQGLSDLALGIDEINRVTTDKIYEARAQELDELSRKARARREELATRLYTAETDSRVKLRKVRHTAQSNCRMSRLPSGFLWTFFVLQVVLILAMYQLAMKHARDIFLSTYYDPFYPDLHLYSIRPDTLRQRIPLSTSWISLLDTLQRDGWKATFSLLQDTLSIFIYDIRTRIWETWGSDTAQQVASWPPT